jgi:beta-phosphoglucomutase-like phosphatase (HAD superfamily)
MPGDALLSVAAVLFDMDGTLVESDASVRRAWEGWCAEYGVTAGRAAGAMVASLRGVASDLPLRDLFHLAALLPATRPAGASPRTK